MMNDVKEIKLGAIISYVTIVFNILTGLLYTPWMIKQIGDSQYALYVMAVSIIAVLTMDFGLGSATSKFIAEYNAKKDFDKVNEYIANSFAIFSGISFIVFIAVIGIWLCLDSVYDNLSLEELSTFKGLYLIVGTYSVMLFPFVPLNSILGGSGRFFELKLSILVQRFLNVMCIVIALLADMGVFALVLVNAFTGILMTLLQFFFVKRIGTVHVSWRMVSWSVIKSIGGFSLWLLISQICQNLFINMVPAVIGASLSSHDVTIFSVALTLERYVLTFSNGINGLFLPKVSSIMVDSKNREKRITELMVKVGKLSLCIVGCIIVGYVIAGKGFIDLWMGESYRDIYMNALILMIPLILSCSQQIGYTYLMMSGKIRYQTVTDMLTSLLGVVLVIIFVKPFGAVGVSTGISISVLLNSLIMNVLFIKMLNIDMIEFYKKTYIKWIACSVVSISCGYAVSKYLIINQWKNLVIEGIIIVGIYGITTMLLYFSKRERQELVSFIRR